MYLWMFSFNLLKRPGRAPMSPKSFMLPLRHKPSFLSFFLLFVCKSQAFAVSAKRVRNEKILKFLIGFPTAHGQHRGGDSTREGLAQGWGSEVGTPCVTVLRGARRRRRWGSRAGSHRTRTRPRKDLPEPAHRRRRQAVRRLPASYTRTECIHTRRAYVMPSMCVLRARMAHRALCRAWRTQQIATGSSACWK